MTDQHPALIDKGHLHPASAADRSHLEHTSGGRRTRMPEHPSQFETDSVPLP
jgi:hypothetical protein